MFNVMLCQTKMGIDCENESNFLDFVEAGAFVFVKHCFKNMHRDQCVVSCFIFLPIELYNI